MRLNEDLYLNFAGMNGDRAVIQSYVFPLVAWIWMGALTLIFGTLVALVPSKVKREYARTQVVGIHEEACTGGKVASCCCSSPACASRRPSRSSSSDDVRRVARHVSCQCGSCSEDANCMMSARAVRFLQTGAHEDLQDAASGALRSGDRRRFIQEYGAKIYRADPNAFGWVVPYSALALGIARGSLVCPALFPPYGAGRAAPGQRRRHRMMPLSAAIANRSSTTWRTWTK